MGGSGLTPRRRVVAAFVAVLGIVFLSSAATEAGAASLLTVTTTSDGTDVNPGDGVCETAPGNAVCTLRAAVQEANALAGPDTVSLPSGTYMLTLLGADEDAAATGDLDIID